jgi:hypothetical protein
MLSMKSQIFRNGFLTLTAVTALAAAFGCSSDSSSKSSSDGGTGGSHAGGAGGSGGGGTAGTHAGGNGGLGTAGAGGAGTGGADAGSDGSAPGSKKRLFVWAGPRAGAPGAKTTDDVVVAIDIDKTSPTYKKALQVVDVGSKNNEPHHGEICNNRLLVGGLYSGKLISMMVDPATGKLGAPSDVPAVPGADLGGTDEVVCVGDHIFTSWLGTSHGASPGGIVEYKGSDMSVVGVYPRPGEDAPAETGTVNGTDLATVTGANTLSTFNPHGMAIDPDDDVMMTADAVLPNSTMGGGPPTFRTTVRVWQYSTRKIIQTIPLCPGVGAVVFVPGSHGTRAIADCNTQLWSLDKDMSDGGGGKWKASLAMTPSGAITPLGPLLGVMTTALTDKVVFFAQPDPGLVVKIDVTGSGSAVKELGHTTTGPGTHYIHNSPDGTRLYASDYVLQSQELAGLTPSDGKVWIIDTATMQADGAAVDFHGSTDPLIHPLGDLNPHGVIPFE